MIDESRINPNLDKLYQHFETVKCYNCGSKEISGAFVVSRFRHVRCKNCGMVYVSPRLKDAICRTLYNEAPYTDFYRIKLIPSIDYRRNVLAINKYNQIFRYAGKTGKVLDIGSGVGEVLSVFKEKGWDCTGIEFNEFAADYSRKTWELNILNKNIYDIKLSEEYDVIMFWGVLEHLFEPVNILKKAHSLLKKDGLLLLEVPSADSVLVRYYEKTQKRVDRIIEGDRHIMLFSRRGLNQMTQKAGFVPREIISNGLDISTLNRLEMGNNLTLEQVNALQALVDTSMQGDLLRGFFKKG